MKIVIDTNRIIAALLKKSTTRDILFDDYFEFVTPDYTMGEIRKHEEELLMKVTLLILLVNNLREKILIIL